MLIKNYLDVPFANPKLVLFFIDPATQQNAKFFSNRVWTSIKQNNYLKKSSIELFSDTSDIQSSCESLCISMVFFGV